MRIKAAQLELRACADAFNLSGERGIDGARVVAEMAEVMRREREARAWQEKMQRKLSECPGFVGCRPPGEQSAGSITVQPSAADEAMKFLARRYHVGPVGWTRGLGLTIEVLPRRKGVTRAVARRRLAPVEQFQLPLEQEPPCNGAEAVNSAEESRLSTLAAFRGNCGRGARLRPLWRTFHERPLP